MMDTKSRGKDSGNLQVLFLLYFGILAVVGVFLLIWSLSRYTEQGWGRRDWSEEIYIDKTDEFGGVSGGQDRIRHYTRDGYDGRPPVTSPNVSPTFVPIFTQPPMVSESPFTTPILVPTQTVSPSAPSPTVVSTVTPSISITTTPTVSTPPVSTPAPSSTVPPEPSREELSSIPVYLVIFMPKDPSTGKTVVEYFNWGDPQTLTGQVIQAFDSATSGQVGYFVREVKVLGEFPLKQDGFRYDFGSYKICVTSRGAECHYPDTIDYVHYVSTLDLCNKRSRGDFVEVWFWGGPWFGFWESNLVAGSSTEGFDINSNPTIVPGCNTRFIIMGFNYERNYGNALHDFGHRIEFTLNHYLGETLTNNIMTGVCGTTHIPPNTTKEYEYDNRSYIDVKCGNDHWKYPYAGYDREVRINCQAWGALKMGISSGGSAKYLRPVGTIGGST